MISEPEPRAASVRKYLGSLGVNGSRMTETAVVELEGTEIATVQGGRVIELSLRQMVRK